MAFGQTQSLRITFRSLDVDSRSKTKAMVQCPRRTAPLTADTCARCQHFRRIELRHGAEPVLRCLVPTEPGAASGGVDESPVTVQSVLRVPRLCAALDTPLGMLVGSRASLRGQELIPVLDHHAKPRGYVTSALLERMLSEGVTLDRRLAEVMTPFLTRVAPTLSLADAARLLACSFSGHLVVVGSDGGLLGVVSQEDLPAHASAS